ncbi:MAG: butyrate kinase [bacterium]
MSHRFTILIINPGSTSTKISIAEDDRMTFSETLRHDLDELKGFTRIWDQFHYRLMLCRHWSAERLQSCSAVVARGGLLRPLPGGTYHVTTEMLDDARNNLQGEHASNLGSALAHVLAGEYQCPAFIVDPVSVDEFEPLARFSGLPFIERKSLSHALNLHAAGRRAAKEMNLRYEDSRFVICHLGGGISVAPLRGGKIIDVNDASSDGPFAPGRSGGLPLQQFITFACSGTYSESELRSFVSGNGGLLAYLGTNDLKEVEERIDRGDSEARLVFEAMAYQIAKEIGAMATVLNGNVHAIILTGGAAHSQLLTSWIEERVRFIAPVSIFAGEDEMDALAEGALRVLRGDEEAKPY